MESSTHAILLFSPDGSQLRYANPLACRTFGISDLNQLSALDSWTVYKLEGKEYVAGGGNLKEWVKSGDLSRRLIKRGESEEPLLDFDGNKLIFNKTEGKVYTFQDISHVHKCKFPNSPGCESRLLLNTVKAELRKYAEGLIASVEALSGYVQPEGLIYMESTKSTAHLLEHLVNEVNVS